MNRIKVAVVDDHPAVRRGLVDTLEKEEWLEVPWEADNAEDAWRSLNTDRPQVIILDLSLKSGSAFDLIRSIKATTTSPKVIVYSMHDEALYGERVFKAGADAYVNKQEPITSLLGIIREVLQGRSPSEAYGERRKDGGGGTTRAEAEGYGVESLTNRQLEVFELMGHGLSTQDIAQRLKLSPKTIEAHQAHIKDRLGITNYGDLLRRATIWVAREA